jgi:hypothetical protein
MRSRLYFGLATLLIVGAAGWTPGANGLEPGGLAQSVALDPDQWIPFNTFKPSRLAALTARQNLHDDVCIAMTDGRIDRAERYTILSHAKGVLTKQEYEGLKRTMNRLSPPQKAAGTPRTAKHSASATRTVAFEQPVAPVPLPSSSY